MADTLKRLRSRLAAAGRKVRASESRRALPAGSSRARVTSANARWKTACEARDRIERELTEAEQAGEPS